MTCGRRWEEKKEANEGEEAEEVEEVEEIDEVEQKVRAGWAVRAGERLPADAGDRSRDRESNSAARRL